MHCTRPLFDPKLTLLDSHAMASGYGSRQFAIARIDFSAAPLFPTLDEPLCLRFRRRNIASKIDLISEFSFRYCQTELQRLLLLSAWRPAIESQDFHFQQCFR